MMSIPTIRCWCEDETVRKRTSDCFTANSLRDCSVAHNLRLQSLDVNNFFMFAIKIDSCSTCCHLLVLQHVISLWVCLFVCLCIVLYSSIYIAPLNSHRQTEALLVRLAPRKE